MKSALQLSFPWYRAWSNGVVYSLGGDGVYWSSTWDGIYATRVYLSDSVLNISNGSSPFQGNSVRCFKN
jgi:hypothetical protein